MSWLFKLWRWYQRRIDMMLLWPEIKKQTDSLERARGVFYFHMIQDEVWTKDYTDEGLCDFVKHLN